MVIVESVVGGAASTMERVTTMSWERAEMEHAKIKFRSSFVTAHQPYDGGITNERRVTLGYVKYRLVLFHVFVRIELRGQAHGHEPQNEFVGVLSPEW